LLALGLVEVKFFGHRMSACGAKALRKLSRPFSCQEATEHVEQQPLSGACKKYTSRPRGDRLERWIERSAGANLRELFAFFPDVGNAVR
jgi:hypothetical protein